jgi:hypothetical protein
VAMQMKSTGGVICQGLTECHLFRCCLVHIFVTNGNL